MSVLIYIDHADGQIKKNSLEVLSYGAALAKQLNTSAEGLLLGTVSESPAELGKYGVSQIHHANNEAFNTADTQSLAQAIIKVAQDLDTDVLIFSFGTSGISVAPRVSATLKAGLVTGVVALPDISDGFVVKKTAFSAKAFAYVKINSEKKIIALSPNSYGVRLVDESAVATVNALNVAPPLTNKVEIKSVEKATGDVPLAEAEIVVSGGRGLKGPENWYLITDLAHALHGAVACTRPVADDGWRPHHEHVGQTGVQIAPNLYIAIGISGAIQHLGGVNRSKTIVVINKDADAPFFKAADYGIVGDAFEIVPKLTEAVKKWRG